MTMANGNVISVTGVDTMWRYPLGSCNSVVSTKIDGNNDEWIEVKKVISYGKNGRADKTDLGELGNIFLEDPNASSEISFCCRFRSSITTNSDKISISEGNTSEGKMTAEGSWKDSLQILYMDSSYTNQRADSYVEILGQTLFVKVIFSASVISEKVNWFVNSCDVEEVDEGEVTGAKVPIIEDLCYAQILDTKPDSEALQSASNYRYSNISFFDINLDRSLFC